MKRRTCLAGIAELLERRVLLSRVTFTPVVSFPTGGFPDFITTADINGDGHPDIITADYADGEVSVLLGNGNGTFQPPINTPVGNGPTSIAVADVNGDGKLDLIVANSGGNSADPDPDRDTISILLGNGDGTFAPKFDLAAGLQPLAVAVADLNGDGHPDIVVANRFDNAVGVFLGNGDGTFAPQIEYPVGQAPEAIAVADLNGDGHPDIVTANRVGGTVSVLLGNGDGTFQPPVEHLVGDNPRSVAIADLNLDGFPDIITSNYSSNSVSVLLNNGLAKFPTLSTYTTGGFPFSLAVADMNLDGRPDIITADQRADTVSVLLRSFDATLRMNIDFPVGTDPTSVAVADLNGDGKPDIITANFNQNTVSVLLSTLQPSSTRLIASQTTVPIGGRVQFTAFVTTPGFTPTGNVQFFEGLTLLRTVPVLPDGTARISTIRFPLPGVQTITAQYVGGLVGNNSPIGIAGSIAAPVTVTIVPPIAGQPVLVPLLDSVDLPLITPLAVGIAGLTINNQGSTSARGLVGVQLYASTDQTFSTNDIPLAVPFAVKISLSGRQSTSILRRFVVTANPPPGDYFVLAVLTPISGLLLSYVSAINGFTASPFRAT